MTAALTVDDAALKELGYDELLAAWLRAGDEIATLKTEANLARDQVRATNSQADWSLYHETTTKLQAKSRELQHLQCQLAAKKRKGKSQQAFEREFFRAAHAVLPREMFRRVLRRVREDRGPSREGHRSVPMQDPGRS